VRSAAEETDRLVQLAEDLLVIARTDAGTLPIHIEALPASELLGAVAKRFLGSAPGGAEITTDAPEGLRLAGDRLRLEQALGNLVDNALRHGGTRIELLARADAGGVLLSVRDDGPGFPEEFVGVAFERFSRGDPARGRGGAGLGLAIVRAIATAHGGQAGARNRPEGGADVWLRLPGASQSSPSSSPSPSTTTTSKPSSSRTSTSEPSGRVTSTS
jgi:signal transduction histidine kinase